jgi:hypothetical protein
MRNVLIISDGDDMAGVNHSIKVAFDRFSTKYRLRQVRGTNNYIDYPVDIPWMGNNTLVNSLYNEADLVHISEYPWALDGRSAPKIWEPVEKPTVIHQHGSPFRNNPKLFLDIAKKNGYTQIVSTVDLLVDDSLEWVPNPVDIDLMQAIRKAYYPNDGIIRIGHGPTNRAIKNTSEFLSAVSSIGCDYLLVENHQWRTALREKARCDIWYDQLTFGYGNNGIEAGAMGIPTVGGFANPAHKETYIRQVGSLPFVEAEPHTLRSVLSGLVQDAELRRAESERILSLVRGVHGQRPVVERLEKIYDRTIDEFEAR